MSSTIAAPPVYQYVDRYERQGSLTSGDFECHAVLACGHRQKVREEKAGRTRLECRGCTAALERDEWPFPEDPPDPL